jgi:hypothetical protein
MEKRNLPTIQELRGSDAIIASKQNELNVLLNQNPSEQWVKIHPLAKGVRYIPIERVEWLLTNIFQRWRVEIMNTQLIANSIVVHIKLHYQSVLDGSWDWQDGIGAAPLQTDKGSGAVEFDKIKNDAVMKAAPAAESFAVKDAAQKIGKLFGKDLNRADELGYTSMRERFQASPMTITRCENLINDSLFPDEEKAAMEKELEDITEAEASRMIEYLYPNQLDKINAGHNYSQTDIKNKLKDI